MLRSHLLLKLLCIGCLFARVGYGQDRNTQLGYDSFEEERIFAQRLSQLIPAHELFTSESFVKGYIVFENGKRTDLLDFNYNTLFSQMVFISGADTLYLNTNERIQYIYTETNQFYYHPKWGYFSILAKANNDVRLAVQRKLEIRRRTRLEEHENPEPINTREFFSVMYYPKSYLLKKEQVLLKRKSLFVLLDKDGNPQVANARGFKRMFPERKHEIDKLIRQHYSDRNKLRFDRLEDVSEVFTLCGSE